MGGERMKWSLRQAIFGEQRAIEPSQAAWMRLITDWENPTIATTPDRALTATPVMCAVDFLSSAMSSLGRIVEELQGEKWVRLSGKLDNLLNGAVNDEWDADRWIKYSFWQTLTGGRQFTWIERPNGQILNLWPLQPSKVTIFRAAGRTVYKYQEDGRAAVEYPAADIIDIPFALEPDQLTHISPLKKGETAIGLLLAMEKYASSFFAGGGVLPLAVTGPPATGPDAQKRMVNDISRVIKQAKEDGKQIFPLPGGYTISPVGFDPQKGQMTEARRFQVEEIARIYRLPPWFLQDLTQANFANSENQDLHLVKHTLTHWANAWESQMNLKVFGRRVNNRRVRLNMDSLLRGDFKARADAIASLVQSGVYTPNDGRGYMGLEKSDDPNADKLHMQGATVPLGTQPASSLPPSDGAEPGTSDN
jgi:HK97 family phage portal protein